MGIDIRDSPHQIECIHCGDCIDACADVLGRLGRPGLIHYAWGTQGEVFGQQGRSWLQRIGVRDAKRAVLVLVLLFYASGLAVALSMRHPMLVKISPDRTKLYWLAGREVRNHYRMTLENRMHENGFVTLSIDGLNGAHLVLPQNPVPVAGGLEWSGVFEIAAPLGTLPPGVSPFRIVARAEPGGVVDVFTMTFIAPESKGLQ
jgi:polyferredoxin